MNGGFVPTPMSAKDKKKFLDIENDSEHKIKNLIIHNIPLSTSKSMSTLKTIGKMITPFIHSALTPSLSHIIIQLNMEDSDFIYFIEYGQYLSSSSNEPQKNKHDFYYINEDGARITRLSYDELKDRGNDSKEFSRIIAEKFYGEIKEEIFQKISKDFHRVECDIKNKITLRELCDNFKNEKWLAKKYNVATHNCQDFATEIIKILKAVRKHEIDKVRTNEKLFLPNSLIKALWHNEDLSLVNTLGRIPVFGLFYDLGYNIGGMITDKMKK